MADNSVLQTLWLLGAAKVFLSFPGFTELLFFTEDDVE